VQTGNFFRSNPGTTGSISDNQIAATRRGIFHNQAYGSASPLTISGNTLTVVNEAASRWDAIMLSGWPPAARPSSATTRSSPATSRRPRSATKSGTTRPPVWRSKAAR